MKQKVISLTVILMGMLTLIGGVGFLGANLTSSQYKNLVQVQVPVREVVDRLDLQFANLHRSVYQALHAAIENQIELKREVAEDLKVLTERFRDRLEDMDQVPFTEPMRYQFLEIKHLGKNYLKLTEEVVGYSFTEQPDVARQKLAEFNAIRSNLRLRIDKLSRLAEAEAKMTASYGLNLTHRWQQVMGVLLGLGICSCMILIAGMLTDLMGHVDQVVHPVLHSNSRVWSTSLQGAASLRSLKGSEALRATGIHSIVFDLERFSLSLQTNRDFIRRIQSVTETTGHGLNDGREQFSKLDTAMQEIDAVVNRLIEHCQSGDQDRQRWDDLRDLVRLQLQRGQFSVLGCQTALNQTAMGHGQLAATVDSLAVGFESQSGDLKSLFAMAKKVDQLTAEGHFQTEDAVEAAEFLSQATTEMRERLETLARFLSGVGLPQAAELQQNNVRSIEPAKPKAA